MYSLRMPTTLIYSLWAAAKNVSQSITTLDLRGNMYWMYRPHPIRNTYTTARTSSKASVMASIEAAYERRMPLGYPNPSPVTKATECALWSQSRHARNHGTRSRRHCRGNFFETQFRKFYEISWEEFLSNFLEGFSMKFLGKKL